jgi:hypothetical protein
MKKNYYMSDEDFTEFLKKIGGVKSGYFPDREPIVERHFFGVGNGWLGLIKEMMEDIISMGWNKEITQVKEKFGGLCFYITSAPENVHMRIIDADKISYTVCEICGDTGNNKSHNGWYQTLCEKHHQEKSQLESGS